MELNTDDHNNRQIQSHDNTSHLLGLGEQKQNINPAWFYFCSSFSNAWDLPFCLSYRCKLSPFARNWQTFPQTVSVYFTLRIWGSWFWLD